MIVQDRTISGLVNVTQAAKLIGISRAAVTQAILAGKIPANTDAGLYLMRREAVEEFQRARDAQPQKRRPGVRRPTGVQA